MTKSVKNGDVVGDDADADEDVGEDSVVVVDEDDVVIEPSLLAVHQATALVGVGIGIGVGVGPTDTTVPPPLSAFPPSQSQSHPCGPIVCVCVGVCRGATFTVRGAAPDGPIDVVIVVHAPYFE